MNTSLHELMMPVCKGIILIIVLADFSNPLVAQQTAVWQISDTARNHYTSGNGLQIARSNVLAAADENHVVALGRATLASETTTLLRLTTDGGLTWKSSELNSGRENMLAVAHPGPQTIVVAGDANEILAVVDGQLRSMYRGSFYLSSDAGQSWKNTVLDSNTRLAGLAMYDDQQGVMLQWNVTNIFNDEKLKLPDSLLCTKDGWKSWKAVALPQGVRICAEVLCPAPEVYIVRDVEDLANERYVLYISTDGGTTWRKSEPMPDGVANIYFFDALTGFGVGGQIIDQDGNRSDRIAKTSDGGFTWSLLLDSALEPTLGLLEVDFADETNGIALGRRNKILRTSDGGKTWLREFIPCEAYIGGSKFLQEIVYPKSDRSLAVFFNGPFVRYTGEETLQAPVILQPSTTASLAVDTLQIEWTPVAGAMRYHLEVALQPGDLHFFDLSRFDTPIVSIILDETSFSLEDLIYGYKYYIRVRALNDFEQSDWSCDRKRTIFRTEESTDALIPPRIVFPLHEQEALPVTLNIQWQAVEDAVSYDVQVATDFGFSGNDVMPLNAREIVDTSHVVSGLQANTVYYVRTRVRTSEDISKWSSQFSLHSFRTGTLTGVDDRHIHSEGVDDIVIFPQPIIEAATIRLAPGMYAAGSSLQLIDLLGNTVRDLSGSIQSDAGIILDRTGLASGVYLLRYSDGAAHALSKVVIIK